MRRSGALAAVLTVAVLAAPAVAQAHVLSLARASAAAAKFARDLSLQLDQPQGYGVDGCRRVNLHTVDCRYHTVDYAVPLDASIRCDDVVRIYYITGSYLPRTNSRVSLQPACYVQ